MTNDNARPLSRKANTMDLELLLVLGRLQGYFTAQDADGGKVFAPTQLAEIRADLDAYVFEGKAK